MGERNRGGQQAARAAFTGNRAPTLPDIQITGIRSRLLARRGTARNPPPETWVILPVPDRKGIHLNRALLTPGFKRTFQCQSPRLAHKRKQRGLQACQIGSDGVFSLMSE